MLNLDTGHAVVILDRIGQPAQADHIFIITDPQLVGGGLTVFVVHIRILHDDHTDLALRQILIAADQTGRNGPVHMAEPGRLRGFADPVLDLYIADLARTK